MTCKLYIRKNVRRMSRSRNYKNNSAPCLNLKKSNYLRCLPHHLCMHDVSQLQQHHCPQGLLRHFWCEFQRCSGKRTLGARYCCSKLQLKNPVATFPSADSHADQMLQNIPALDNKIHISRYYVSFQANTSIESRDFCTRMSTSKRKVCSLQLLFFIQKTISI